MLKRRQAKADALRAAGFLHFEAVALSKLPRGIPYVQQMAAERSAELERFVKRPSNRNRPIPEVYADYRQRIYNRYIKNNWIGRKGLRSETSVFMMMKDVAEKPYKRANPEYEKNKARYPKGSHHANSDISLDMLHHTSRASRKQYVRNKVFGQ